MENKFLRYHGRKTRLGYSFVSALILEVFFLAAIGNIVLLVRHYIHPLGKVHALSISVVDIPVKKKVKVAVKKKVVKVKHIEKVVKKIVEKHIVIRSVPVNRPVVVRNVPVNRPVVPVLAPIQAPSASIAAPPAPMNLPKDSNKKIPLSVLDKYFGEIKGKIESNLVYPGYAKREGMDGYVTVMFKILRDGSLVFARIKDSSSHEILNSSALKTIRISSPFPGFPEGIHKSSLTFLIKINFKLESGYRD